MHDGFWFSPYSYKYTGPPQIKQVISGNGGMGAIWLTNGGPGLTTRHTNPSESIYSSGFIASCLSPLSFFLSALVCSAKRALVAALRSATSFKRVYSMRASGEIVRIAGRFVRSLVSGSDLTEYQTHAGGPSVFQPAALRRGCSSLKSWSSASKRSRSAFHSMFTLPHHDTK